MELMTVREVAEELRVSPMTVRRYIAAGRLAAVRVGRGVRVHRAAVEKFAEPIAPDASEDDSAEVGVLTSDDTLWNIVGTGRSAEPSNIRRFKDDYVADAILPRRSGP